MTDKYKENNGPSEVDQSRDADEVFDETDDINVKKNSEIKVKDIEKNLDRGEELYSSFGFDSNRDSTDTKIADQLETARIDSKKVNEIVDNPTTRQSVTVEDREVFVPSNDKTTKQKPSDTESIETIEKQDPRTSDSTIVIRANDKVDDHVEDRKAPIPSPGPAYEDNIVGADEFQKTIGENTEKTSYREVPENTKVIIKADDGDINYRQRQVDSKDIKASRDYGRSQSPTKTHRHTHTVYDVLINESNTPGQVPADYQVRGVYYKNDPRPNTLDNTPISAYKTYNTVSIKDHYKSKRKASRPGLPIKKIALGVGALAGLALVLLPNEDDGPFWR